MRGLTVDELVQCLIALVLLAGWCAFVVGFITGGIKTLREQWQQEREKHRQRVIENAKDRRHEG